MSTFGASSGVSLEDYFSTSMPSGVARRTAQDVAAVRAAHRQQWPDVSQQERDQLLDEALVPPAVRERYSSEPSVPLPNGVQAVYPRLRVQTGQKKVVVEDTAGSQGEDLDSGSSSCVSCYTYGYLLRKGPGYYRRHQHHA